MGLKGLKILMELVKKTGLNRTYLFIVQFLTMNMIGF